MKQIIQCLAIMSICYFASSCSGDLDGEQRLGVKIENLSGLDLKIYTSPDVHTEPFVYVESIPAGFNGVLATPFDYRSGTFLEARTEDEMLYGSIWFLVDDYSRDVFEWTIN